MMLKSFRICTLSNSFGDKFGIALSDTPIRHNPTATMLAASDRIPSVIAPFYSSTTLAVSLPVHMLPLSSTDLRTEHLYYEISIGAKSSLGNQLRFT